MRLLIANGYVIDPSQGINSGHNLLIEDGRVKGLVERSEGVPEGAEVLDATGLVVAPGFIDLHTHLREPGQEYKETIQTGAAAAVAGSYHSVCPLAKSEPRHDNSAWRRLIIRPAEAPWPPYAVPAGARTTRPPGTEHSER